MAEDDRLGASDERVRWSETSEANDDSRSSLRGVAIAAEDWPLGA
jgi:hypothetical protein